MPSKHGLQGEGCLSPPFKGVPCQAIMGAAYPDRREARPVDLGWLALFISGNLRQASFEETVSGCVPGGMKAWLPGGTGCR
jgi:hypothetical protein